MLEKTKHTPGDWYFAANGIWKAHGRGRHFPRMLAQAFGETAEDGANYRLMAAAPELLELCEEFAADCHHGKKSKKATHLKAMAVIKKAKGEVRND